MLPSQLAINMHRRFSGVLPMKIQNLDVQVAIGILNLLDKNKALLALVKDYHVDIFDDHLSAPKNFVVVENLVNGVNWYSSYLKSAIQWSKEISQQSELPSELLNSSVKQRFEAVVRVSTQARELCFHVLDSLSDLHQLNPSQEAPVKKLTFTGVGDFFTSLDYYSTVMIENLKEVHDVLKKIHS